MRQTTGNKSRRKWLRRVEKVSGCRTPLRLHQAKVFVEHSGEVLPVALPMSGGRIIFQAGNPVAVELVDDGVDAVALEPAVAHCAWIEGGLLRVHLLPR